MATALDLIPFLPQMGTDTACLLPAPLDLVKACAHYAFQVRMPGGLVMPCQKIVALVKSTESSDPAPIGTGYKLVTRNVEDVLATEAAGAEEQKRIVLSSMCTLGNVNVYKLDPPRGGAQHAVVTITGQVDGAYIVEHVQQVSAEDAAAAKVSLLKLLQVAVEINSQDSDKRKREWNEDESPAKARKCRVLGRCPTGDEVNNPFTAPQGRSTE